MRLMFKVFIMLPSWLIHRASWKWLSQVVWNADMLRLEAIVFYHRSRMWRRGRCGNYCRMGLVWCKPITPSQVVLRSSTWTCWVSDKPCHTYIYSILVISTRSLPAYWLPCLPILPRLPCLPILCHLRLLWTRWPEERLTFQFSIQCMRPHLHKGSHCPELLQRGSIYGQG